MVLGLAMLLSASQPVRAETNGVALLPPMGFNPWAQVGTDISESWIEGVADQMATNGMKAAGYQYVNVDDGWAGFRDTNGTIVADTNKFPHGLKAVADYVHAKGLKFGLYTTGGTNTCAEYVGSAGHEVQDANTFASWGVDYVKFEGCDLPWWELIPHEQTVSLRMGQALLHSGRPMVFSLSIGAPENWIPNYCNLPRGTGDIIDIWASVLGHIDSLSASPFKDRPGMWNDGDALELSGSLNTTEAASMFSMWCMLASPLLTSTVAPGWLFILTNTEAIAVDQDPAGIPAVCVASNANTQVWHRPLGGTNTGTLAVALLNRGDFATNITVNWSDLGLAPEGAAVRDLWAHAAVGNFTNHYTANVPAHGVQMLKVVGTPLVPLAPPGTNYLSDMTWLASTAANYPIERDKSQLGTPILLGLTTYTKGLGTQTQSQMDFYLGAAATQFISDIGIDSRACCGTGAVDFQVYGDGALLYDSGVITTHSLAKNITLNVTGVQILSLRSTNTVVHVDDDADWAGARVVVPVHPSFTWAAPQNGGVQLSGTGGVPNGFYYVLASTNPLLPAKQWTTISTDFFDGSGNFNFTSAVSTNLPRRFFRVLAP